MPSLSEKSASLSAGSANRSQNSGNPSRALAMAAFISGSSVENSTTLSSALTGIAARTRAAKPTKRVILRMLFLIPPNTARN
jgi:hypothetical protein